MRKWALVAIVVVSCRGKQQVEAPEAVVNSCVDAIESVKKQPRQSEAACMRVLKITRKPPQADAKVLVLGKLTAQNTLEDPTGSQEAKSIPVRKDGAFHDDCPAGNFLEVEGKLSTESGLVEARIVRVLDDWQKSSCASDEGPPPPPPVALPPPFDKEAAGVALMGALKNLQKCKTQGVPSASSHITVEFGPDGTVKKALVDKPPFEGTKTGRCIEELITTGLKVTPYSGAENSIGATFTL